MVAAPTDCRLPIADGFSDLHSKDTYDKIKAVSEQPAILVFPVP